MICSKCGNEILSAENLCNLCGNLIVLDNLVASKEEYKVNADNRMFKYSKNTAKQLYKPMFIKRLLISMVLLVAPIGIEIICAYIARIIIRTMRISISSLEGAIHIIATLMTIFQFASVVLFLYSFIWYFLKKTESRYCYINAIDGGIEYFIKVGGGLINSPIYLYLYEVKNILNVSQSKENIVLHGDVIKYEFEGSRKTPCEMLKSIEIPKVFEDLNIFKEKIYSYTSQE